MEEYHTTAQVQVVTHGHASTEASAHRVALPSADKLVVDLCFLVEATEENELPETVAGCGRLSHLDLSDKRIPMLEPSD